MFAFYFMGLWGFYCLACVCFPGISSVYMRISVKDFQHSVCLADGEWEQV